MTDHRIRGLVPDERLVVTLTVAELRQLVTDAARDALANGASQGPVLLDRHGLARALGVSASTIDKLRRDGCPVLWVGASPRFELAACIEWLRVPHKDSGWDGQARLAARST